MEGGRFCVNRMKSTKELNKNFILVPELHFGTAWPIVFESPNNG
jgi:hypothetical protein